MELFRKSRQLKTTAMVQPVDDLAFSDGIRGKERLTEYSTETGEQVLCSYGPVTIPGLNWILVSQLDKAEVLRPVHRLTGYLVISGRTAGSSGIPGCSCIER